MSWSKEALYVLAEIKDDFLVDKIKNPLERWWDDDCVEIFIDEDNSGGNHQFNHNAFAYHVGLNGDVVDLDAKDIPKLFNSHIDSKMTIGSSNTTVWEFKIYLFPDTYTLNGDQTALTFSIDTKEKLDAAVSESVQKGATIIKDPFMTYYHWYLAVLRDPDGNAFRLACTSP